MASTRLFYMGVNFISVGVGISLGYFSTNYFYFSPKKETLAIEDQPQTIHISELDN